MVILGVICHWVYHTVTVPNTKCLLLTYLLMSTLIWIYVYLYPFIELPISISIHPIACTYIYLSLKIIIGTKRHKYVYTSVSANKICEFIYIYTFPPLSLCLAGSDRSNYLPTCLSTRVSTCLSMRLYVSLSFSLWIFHVST